MKTKEMTTGRNEKNEAILLVCTATGVNTSALRALFSFLLQCSALFSVDLYKSFFSHGSCIIACLF